jgi:hypothetical protein
MRDLSCLAKAVAGIPGREVDLPRKWIAEGPDPDPSAVLGAAVLSLDPPKWPAEWCGRYDEKAS